MDTALNQKKLFFPFNNSVETGLRMLSILNASFPVSFDISTLVFLDYLTVHSGDIDDNMKSLHPAVPNRTGEILVRRNIIEEGLEVFISKGLIDKVFLKDGIEYKASDDSTSFLEALGEEYTTELIKRAEWVISRFSKTEKNELRKLMYENIDKWKSEFNLEILS